MKKIILLRSLFILYIIVFVTSTVKAQAPNWSWALKAGGAHFDFGSSVKLDDNGNSFVTGGFSSASITFGTTTLTNNLGGTPDFFVVKYDGAGSVVWAKSFGGNAYDVGSSIAVDASGYCYITGYFTSPIIDFGSTTIYHTPSSNPNIFLLKLDNNGNVLWAKAFGGSLNSNVGRSVAAIQGGGCVIVGSFSDDTLHFDNNYLVNPIAGPDEGFLAKFDASGNNIWCKNIGGNSSDIMKHVGVDVSGNIYVAGEFSSDVINADTLTATNDTTDGSYDFFVAKYDATGNTKWVKGFGGNGDEYVNKLVTDIQGNCWLVGDLKSEEVMFDTTTITKPNNYVSVQFVIKLNSNGSITWIKDYAGNLGLDGSNGIAVDGNGNCYYSGYLKSNNISLGNINITRSNVDGDEFILKLDNSGNEKWVKSYVTKGKTNQIEANSSGSTFITGNFQNNSLVFGNTTLNNSGMTDMFFAKLDAVLGIDDMAINGPILYPNPASETTFLKMNSPLINASIIIYNNMGNEVKKMEHQSGENIKISIENLPASVYFIRIVQEGTIISTHQFAMEK